MKEKSKIDWKIEDIAIIKEHCENAGAFLRVLGPAVFLKQWWVPVEDPDEEDPTYHKESCLELFEPGESYIPTSLRQIIEKEKILRETGYGIGQLKEYDNEIGMWHGPNSNLMDMLNTPGQDDNFVVIKFASDGTNSIIYRWYSKGNCWRKARKVGIYVDPDWQDYLDRNPDACDRTSAPYRDGEEL